MKTAIRTTVVTAPKPLTPHQEEMAMRNAQRSYVNGGPVSDEGRAVVARLNAAITGQEKRKYARGRTTPQFNKAIGAFTADLLLAQGHPKAKGWIRRSLRDGSFDKGPVTRTQAKAVWTGLKALGLIRHEKGYARMKGGIVELYVDAKLCATPALLDICTACGVKVADAKLHFTEGPPQRPVIVKAATTYEGAIKLKGKVMKLIKIPARLEDEVREINEFLRDFTLEHGSHRGFMRIYNNGNVEGFDFNKGGRLYSAGEDSYQNLAGTARLEMTIDGEPVSEVDAKASFMQLLYAFNRGNYEGDPFIVPRLGAGSRGAVKLFVAATIGKGEQIDHWSNKQAKDYLKRTGENLRECWPLARVAKETLALHPLLRTLGKPIAGRLIDWSDLMWIESQAILNTILDLKRNYGIASYPVHDSLIVPRSKADRTVRQLQAHYYGELLNLHPTPTPPSLRVSP